jgi:hypothetical protein
MIRSVEAALCALLVVGAASPAPCEPESMLEISPAVTFYGGSVQVTYWGVPLIEGLDTGIVAAVGAAYEQGVYARNPDGTQYDPPIDWLDLYGDADFNRWRGDWSLGIRQGIAYDAARGRNLLEAFALIRGLYLDHVADESLIFRSDLRDREGILQHSLIVGLAWDDLVEVRKLARNGYRIEASFELAPPALAHTEYGHTDYRRLNAATKGFLTLLDVPAGDHRNRVSLVASAPQVLDFLWGDHVPLNARHSIGGTSLEPAVGGAFRGVGTERFDAYFKAINNLDLRLNLPSVLGAVPGIGIYLDGAFQDDLTRTIGDGSDPFLLSTGLQMVVNFAGVEAGVGLNYFVNELAPSLTLFFGRLY